MRCQRCNARLIPCCESCHGDPDDLLAELAVREEKLERSETANGWLLKDRDHWKEQARQEHEVFLHERDTATKYMHDRDAVMQRLSLVNRELGRLKGRLETLTEEVRLAGAVEAGLREQLEAQQQATDEARKAARDSLNWSYADRVAAMNRMR